LTRNIHATIVVIDVLDVVLFTEKEKLQLLVRNFENLMHNYFVLLGHHPQHSYPVLVSRRGQSAQGGQGRRLPPTPNKPSTLKLQSTNINFPKLNASPTRVS
jgi:hypothetical protein